MVKKKTKQTKKKILKNLVKSREDKQLLGAVGVIILVFGLFLGTYFYVQSLGHFDYAGVRWEKIKEGQLELYYSKFKLEDSPFVYNAYLRNDPRKNDILVDANFKFNKNVLVSFEDYDPACGGKDSYLAAVIGPFLKAMNLNATGATANKEKSEQQNITFADCGSVNSTTSVIVVQSSDEPSIVQSNETPGCYYINVGQCKQIETVERFIVAILGQTSGEKI